MFFFYNAPGGMNLSKWRGTMLSLFLMLVCSITVYGQSSPKLSPAWAKDPPDMNTLISFAKQQSEMRTVVNRYTEDFASLQRRYPVPYSPVRRARLKKFFDGWKTNMNSISFNGLSQEAKIDYILLNQTLDFELHKLSLEEKNWKDFAQMVPFADSLSVLQENRFDKKTLNQRATAALLDSSTDEINALTASLKQNARQSGGVANIPGISRAVASRAADYLNRLGLVLEDWNKFYDGYDPLFNFWARESYERLSKALKEYRNTIIKNVVGITPGDPGPIVGDPVLEEGLQADLTHEMIPYTARELIAIGEREFKWTVDRMKEVSAEMGYGDDWQKALEYVKTLAPPPGTIMDVLYGIADYSFNYISKMNYVTIPPLELEVWRMSMQTPERQLRNPFFSGGENTHASYPTGEMDFKSKMMSMRGNTPSFNFPTVQHELIPGHYQQGFIRSRFNVERSKLSGTPFWHEGNAFYWETILWDKGDFARNNEDKIGMLFWRLHRAARIVFSMNFQLGNWTAQECVDYLVDKVGHEKANAEGEVRRSVMGSTPPLYQIAYAIGAFQQRALYKEVVEGKKMTPKEFHDAILIGGSMPIEMVRARLLNLPLKKDYKTNWRWEGDVL